jgi:hypothetical protein
VARPRRHFDLPLDPARKACLSTSAEPYLIRHTQLFGHEFVMMMCGLTFGPGVGMAIAAAGVIAGDLVTFSCVPDAASGITY